MGCFRIEDNEKRAAEAALFMPDLYNPIQRLIALKCTAGMFVNGFGDPAIIKKPATTSVVTGLFLTLTLFGPVFRIPMPIQIRKPTLWVSFLIWSEYRDSNPRPLGPEPSAIPNFAIPR